MRTVKLGVNVDHIATLRQARGTIYPNPIQAALRAEQAGADQITVHLREDRRHIIDSDLPQLHEVISIPINLEMAATAEMQTIALHQRPDRITLVPEKREERTTEGGLDVAGQADVLSTYIAPFLEAEMTVSMFIDPDTTQIQASAAVGAQAIELHTGDYADADSVEAAQHELQRLETGAKVGAELGLEVAAGHGLHYDNTTQILAIPQIVELNIGHAIVAHAVFVGIEQAVRDMLLVMGRQ